MEQLIERAGVIIPWTDPIDRPSEDRLKETEGLIKALGFEPEELPTLWGQPDLEVTRWGTVKAAFTTGKTAMDGVYAVGDIVRGASLVVWAIRDGREAADAIADRLGVQASIAAE